MNSPWRGSCPTQLTPTTRENSEYKHPTKRSVPINMSSPTTIFAKEMGSAPSAGRNGQETRVIYLDVPIIPREPIHVGQRVRILALIPCDEFFPSEEETSATYYTAEDMGVWGTLVRVRAEEEETVEFVLENDNIRSTTTHAHLTVPRKEGLMIRTPLWRRWLGALTARPAKATRTVLIEDDATVFEDTTTLYFADPGNAAGPA
ncbi:hypothetical protein OH77DRAFT_1445474 [Trametes cingulata]|nr:hypothetical protein OH77DRAFT_1445474 [Trametes cingulata]